MEIFGFLTRPNHKILLYLQVLLLACAVLLTIPDLIVDISVFGNLDGSWMIGLHKANMQGMIHGKDIVFTYGPLGFLTVPIFISRNQWLYSAVYTLSVYGLTLSSFSLYVRKTKANLLDTVIFTVVFVVVFRDFCSGSDFGLPLSVFILSYLYVLGKRHRWLLPGLAFLFSTLLFIKFSYALMVSFTGAAFLFVLVLNKRYKEAFIFVTSGLIALLAQTLLLLGSPKAIVTYLNGCLHISSGYNSSMTVNGDMHQLLFAAFAWLSYIALFIYNAFKKNRPVLIYLAFCSSLLFVSFKYGFVRNDPHHVVYFYSIWMLVFSLYYLSSFPQARIVKYAVLLLILMMLYQHISIPHVSRGYTGSSSADKMKEVRLGYNLLRGIGTEEQNRKLKEDLGRYYSLDTKTVRMLSGHTVDVFNIDIAITELYGFNWHPRPVFQSYSAYTDYLDLLNANYFSSTSAPQYVLYNMRTIDYRYPLFDEPATFRVLLQRYEFCASDKKFIILRRKDPAGVFMEEYIGKTVVKFGEKITLPKVGNGLLFAKVHIEYSLLGHTLKFLFKPPRVYFGFFNEGSGQVCRFVFSNAKNGIFLSQHINNNNLCNVFRGNISRNLSKISILTNYPVCFNDEITIEYFKVIPKEKP